MNAHLYCSKCIRSVSPHDGCASDFVAACSSEKTCGRGHNTMMIHCFPARFKHVAVSYTWDSSLNAITQKKCH